MFGFLKNKLKEWVDKAKDTLKPEEVVEETKEKQKKEPVKKEKPKIKEKAKPKKEKKEEKITEKADKIIEKAKKEKIEEVPLEFNLALNKYEPDLEEIKEKSAKIPESKDSEITLEEKEFELIKEVTEEKTEEEEIKKDLELKEKKLEESSKKQGFISKLFGKKNKEEIKPEPEISKVTPEVTTQTESITQETKKSFFQKVKSSFTYKISEEDFNNLFADLEMLLLENNVALEVVENLKDSLSKKLIGKEIKKDKLEEKIKTELKNSLEELIMNPENPLDLIKNKKQSKEPYVILFFGINGTGKTTSIAKIANLLKENNFSVVLAAADTFRAASIEQIQEHANKLKIPLIKHDYQSDPAAVGFDAIKYAKNHRIDVVLIDTAGRMHTKTNLLAEMGKIVRVTNPDLKIFVAESIAGNDATEQAKSFNEMIGIDGSILSKADVDEKGGTIISVSHITKKPVIYLGTGQNYKDLKLFNKQEYIESLGL